MKDHNMATAQLLVAHERDLEALRLEIETLRSEVKRLRGDLLASLKYACRQMPGGTHQAPIFEGTPVSFHPPCRVLVATYQASGIASGYIDSGNDISGF